MNSVYQVKPLNNSKTNLAKLMTFHCENTVIYCFKALVFQNEEF